ncbi:MAG: hypothetical protein JMN27_15670 [gamma proteobacterium endosymbiont of Lamellibrachia anaximandri]|nr:hypothetical protein [gamma proteobacterium endosymbiont of Lamellibrachia anaximandri]MBL3535251.1 hypothetical protein [gamma proteobacterium endosymbiont of Lamellibrachia anaximandri]
MFVHKTYLKNTATSLRGIRALAALADSYADKAERGDQVNANEHNLGGLIEAVQFITQTCEVELSCLEVMSDAGSQRVHS